MQFQKYGQSPALRIIVTRPHIQCRQLDDCIHLAQQLVYSEA
jgi:hypothetical protein